MSPEQSDSLPVALGALSLVAGVGALLAAAGLVLEVAGVASTAPPGGVFTPVVLAVTWFSAWATAGYLTVADA